MPVPYRRTESELDPEDLAKLAAALREEQHLGSVAKTETTRRLLDRGYPTQNPIDDPIMYEMVKQLVGRNFENDASVGVDPLRARYRPEHGGLNLEGMNIRDDLTEQQRKQMEDDYEYFDYDTNELRKIPIERDTINVLGPENNKDHTWAHEYRHDEISDEYPNRKADARLARTPDNWADALRMWDDDMRRSERRGDPLVGPPQDRGRQVEHDLLNELNRNADTSWNRREWGDDQARPDSLWRGKYNKMKKEQELERMLAEALRAQSGNYHPTPWWKDPDK